MSDAVGPEGFLSLVVCATPMEAEIFTATLREREVPHRTQWQPGGALELQVAEEWFEEARNALADAHRLFFGPSSPLPAGLEDDNLASPEHDSADSIVDPPTEAIDNDEEDSGWQDESPMMFVRDGLPSVEEMRVRAVWPAYLLAGLFPGVGLGHLYAGRFQMFVYLFFCSLLGVLFYQFTRSFLSFGLNLFAWAIDLGLAAYQVKDHNRRALRLKKQTEEAERQFLKSL